MGSLATNVDGTHEIRGVTIITVAIGDNSAVYTGRVRVPKVHVKARDRLACVDVDELNIDVKRHASLFFSNVGPNVLP